MIDFMSFIRHSGSWVFLPLRALNLLSAIDDIDSDRHTMMLSTRDVMMDLITDDSLGSEPMAEVVDKCLYSTLLFRGG